MSDALERETALEDISYFLEDIRKCVNQLKSKKIMALETDLLLELSQSLEQVLSHLSDAEGYL